MDEFGKLQAALWDMDGVLLDSGPFHFAAWQKVFQKRNSAFTQTDMKRTFGMTNAQVIQCADPRICEPKVIDAIGEEKDCLFRASIQKGAEFLPGVEHWLQVFNVHGIKQALASSGSWENIHAVLDALQARSFFHTVVSGEDCASKPAPDVFLEAARQLSVDPDHCLVIEDALPGVQAAAAAGMKCIAVTTTHSESSLSSADIVLRDLDLLTAGIIRELFS